MKRDLLALATRLFPESYKERLKRRWRVPTMDWRLANLHRAGFRPATAIDVGAYKGDWARRFKRHFPEACVLLIEPQDHCRPSLEDFCRENPDSRFEARLLGAASGEALFVEQESNSRVIPPEAAVEHPEAVRRSIISLRDLTSGTPFEQPTLIKVDAQGFELPILEGAGPLVDAAEIVILEVSLIRIGPVPLFHEVDAFMRQLGFLLYDLAEPNYRPRDGALWQIDAFFARRGSKLVESLSWD